jgi:DNA repair protein RadC
MKKHLTSINEITLHYKRPRIDKLPKIIYSADTIEYLKQVIDVNTLDLKEYCWVALLTSNDNLLGISQVSSGSIASCEINLREILQLSLLTNASKVIVIHNHPSGNLKPSARDVKLTKNLLQISNILGVLLVDHLIISSENYFSIRKHIGF